MNNLELIRATRRTEHHDEFDRRVRVQADALRDAFTSGAFDGTFTLGLELEGVAVDPHGRPTPTPVRAIGSVCEYELGRHNAEVNTPPTPLTDDGFADQTTALADTLDELEAAFEAAGCRFVTDGLWAIPAVDGTTAYLTETDDAHDVDRPTNMSPMARYYALNADVTATGPIELDVPGCTRTFPNILLESLATSMQVHLEVPTDDFADYYNAALRTVGPVLALATNAPFLPPDLYDDDVEAETVLDGPSELRVHVFESLNVEDPGKVRFPRDLDAPVDAVDRIVDDRTCAPYLREWITPNHRRSFHDDHWEFLHKQSTCWRWVRPILAATGPRIEYRPHPPQPAVADVIGFQALVVGLVHGIVTTDHPIRDLPWQDARDNMYAATRRGLDATLHWRDHNDTATTDPTIIYDELFDVARRGLHDRGLTPDRVDDLLTPIEARWHTTTTPTSWKRRHVTNRLTTGTPLPQAIIETQRAYADNATTHDSFADWLHH
jgi:hypothetical protein